MRDKREEEWDRERWELEARIAKWEQGFGNLAIKYAKALEDNKKLEDKLDRVYRAGLQGIEHVALANYGERVQEAKSNLYSSLEEPTK